MNQSAFEWSSPSVSRFRASAPQTFAKYHQRHPEVYDRLRALALEAVRAGRTRIGMKQLWERLRWDYPLTWEGEEVKLNNNWTSHYSRKLMAQEPALRNVFEVRPMRKRGPG